MDKEMIHDRLAYYGEDPDLDVHITRVISRLPSKVATFALDRCCFLSVGRATAGMVLPGRIGVHAIEKHSRNVWIILLYVRISPDDLHSVIAHEIAHAWLAPSIGRWQPDPDTRGVR